MTDEKIIDLGTKKPFELTTGSEGTSSQQITALLERFLRYAHERKFQAIGIVMVDEKHSTITAYHMDEGMGVTLAGGAAYLGLRIHNFMDKE